MIIRGNGTEIRIRRAVVALSKEPEMCIRDRILGAIVANVVPFGIPSINGMAVAALCYLIGRRVLSLIHIWGTGQALW